MSIISRASQWLDVPSLDPDDARRRKLLNILLAGIAAAMIILFPINVASDLLNWDPQSQVNTFYLILAIVLIACATLFVINRYWSGRLAAVIFLLSQIVVLLFVDAPQEVASGRSLIVFVIPIMIGSVLLVPYASFIAAFLCSLAITIISISIDMVPNLYAMVAFFVVAMVSWLAASGLERALQDLRALNRELDLRVEQRTGELTAILDSTVDGIIVLDNEGKITVANPAVSNLVAHPSEKIVGLDIETLIDSSVKADHRQMIGDLFRSRETRIPCTKFEWDKKTLSASVAPVCLKSGKEIGTVAVFRDFTREAEIDRMKSTFVSIASHELRTPLNAIMGYSEMLNEGVYGSLTEQQMGAMGRLLANSSHMLSLINNLLDRARIEAGMIKLNIGDFAPSKLVDGVKGVMDVMAHNKGLKLTTHIADNVPDTLTGDWQRLHQILINFVNNAIKFTREGSVGINIYMHDADHWALAVTDTGIGIPEEARQYIFEPFRQVDDSTTREYGGAGLGLSIVKQLVTMMDGRVEVKSKVGKGSTFTVILPLMPSGSDESNPAETDTIASDTVPQRESGIHNQ
jgi:PAS domain S-box-containing protein